MATRSDPLHHNKPLRQGSESVRHEAIREEGPPMGFIWQTHVLPYNTQDHTRAHTYTHKNTHAYTQTHKHALIHTRINKRYAMTDNTCSADPMGPIGAHVKWHRGDWTVRQMVGLKCIMYVSLPSLYTWGVHELYTHLVDRSTWDRALLWKWPTGH